MSQLEELCVRAQAGNLQEGDALLINGLVECVKTLGQAVDEKATTIKNLLRSIFGPSTEKKDKVLNNDDKKTDDDGNPPGSTGKPKKKKKVINYLEYGKIMMT